MGSSAARAGPGHWSLQYCTRGTLCRPLSLCTFFLTLQPGGREVLVSPSLWLNTLPSFSTNLPEMCQNAPQAGALVQGAAKYKLSTATVARVSADGALEPLLQTATAQPSSAA